MIEVTSLIKLFTGCTSLTDCLNGQSPVPRLLRRASICRSRSCMRSVRLPTCEDSENRNQLT